MIERPVIMMITISRKMSPREEFKIINHKQHVLGNIMTASTGSVTFKLSFTYPGVFGQYSSMSAGVDITIPADTLAMKTPADLAKVVDVYKDMSAEYTTNTINEAFRNVGQAEPFKV